jgi:hypothetical protein
MNSDTSRAKISPLATYRWAERRPPSRLSSRLAAIQPECGVLIVGKLWASLAAFGLLVARRRRWEIDA